MRRNPWLCLALLALPAPGRASSGTEGASFLDIPVGAGPASLGSAYTAQAFNAYAPIWNPAGLGFADAVEVAGTHQSYLQSIHYDYLGIAVPFGRSSRRDNSSPASGLGAAVQYLGSGDITSRDEQGNITGSFSTTFAAYSLAFGQGVSDRLSLGVTGKAITESISDASAHAYAGDAGALYKANDRLYLAAVVANVGPQVKLVNES